MLETNKIIEMQISGDLPKPGKTGVDWFIFCAFVNEFNNNAMEIGVGHGGSALSMAAYAKNTLLVDNWSQTWKKENVQNLIKDAEFLDCDSQKLNLQQQFDLVHLDANKDYKKTLHDLRFCSTINSKIIIVDDFLQSFWPNISRAVFDFIKEKEYKILFVSNHQAILAKNSNSKTFKDIVINFPVTVTDNIAHLTYGDLPNFELLDRMINSCKLHYTWTNKTETYVVKNHKRKII